MCLGDGPALTNVKNILLHNFIPKRMVRIHFDHPAPAFMAA